MSNDSSHLDIGDKTAFFNEDVVLRVLRMRLPQIVTEDMVLVVEVDQHMTMQLSILI